MFDLGMTLVDEHEHPFAHVPQALTAISGFKTAGGKPLRTCLVSDFTMATPPATAKKVRPIFEQYLEILDRTGLRSFFEPVDRRVTLSTHANATKPDRAVFETAVRRLRVRAGLDECLLITENRDHVAAARTKLKMHALQFGAASAGSFDFDDWSQAPAMVAHAIDPRHRSNLHAAVGAFLGADDVEVSTVEGDATAGSVTASGRVWFPVSVPEVGEAPVHVAVPVRGTVHVGASGRLRSDVPAPTDADVDEAASFARSLAVNGQIGGANSPGATHAIEVDESGRRRLVRKRFSAI